MLHWNHIVGIALKYLLKERGMNFATVFCQGDKDESIFAKFRTDNFDENGVAALEKFLDVDIINQVKKEWDAFSSCDKETLITKDEPAVVFWLHVLGEKKRIRPISEFPSIKTLVYSCQFQDLIKEICEKRGQPFPEIRLLETIFFYKPPQRGGVLRYHQDVAYFPFMPNNQLAVWIPLVEVNEDNGTLKYALGSHKLGNRRSINLHTGESFDGDERPLIPQTPEDEGIRLFTANLLPGDITIHEGLTWHSSSPNLTDDRPRLALSIRFLLGDTRYSPNPGAAASFLRQMEIQPGESIGGPAFPLLNGSD